MKHIILTRINFKDRNLLCKYLEVTKDILIRCLKEQTNKNFIWSILTNKNDIDFLRSELDYEFLPFTDMDKYFEFVKLNRIEIQTRHDCDDFMSYEYVNKIQLIYSNRIGDVNMIIHAQPTKIDYRTKKEYEMGSKYHDKRNSMFLSLCQSNPTNHIFEYKHGEMYKITEDIVLIEDCKLVIHGNNKLSEIKKNDIEIIL
jgi:hypothetical protein